jgi:hypothetical protein
LVVMREAYSMQTGEGKRPAMTDATIAGVS